MIIVLGSVRVQAEHLSQALTLSREHVARSLLEPGCLSHGVHQDAGDPLHLVFVERWSDLAALHQHFAVPASRSFVRVLATISTAPPSIEIYDAVRKDAAS